MENPKSVGSGIGNWIFGYFFNILRLYFCISLKYIIYLPTVYKINTIIEPNHQHIMFLYHGYTDAGQQGAISYQ